MTLSSLAKLSLLLIGLSSFLLEAKGTYTLQIQFHSYNNPGSLDAAGECCDIGLFGSCLSSCDTEFKTVCLRIGTTSVTQTGQCISGTVHNPGDVGGDSIEFSSSIGSLSNPFSYTGTAIAQQGYQLYVEVYDDDSWNSDDLVDRFVETIPGHPSSVQSKTVSGIYNRASLVMSFTLSCSQNYYGNCSVYCIPRNDAHGHYTCNTTTGAIICRDGWQNTTSNCTDVSCNLVCHSQGGQCTSNGICQCNNGWSGQQCNIPQCAQGCHPQGGYCLEPNQCLCHTNWNGSNCDMALCAVNCSTVGGICNVPNECTCLAGYTGLTCDIDMLPCDHQMPCINGGTCTHTVGNIIREYNCTCQTGFTGTNCETDIDECNNSQQPCQNNGTCVNGVYPGTFQCICLIGWTGELCEHPIDYCQSNPCINNGTCVSLRTTHYCHCPHNYEGLNCELIKNDCIPNPCQNNGICTNLVTNYTCTCMKGFTGYNCQEIIMIETSSSSQRQQPLPTVSTNGQSSSLLGTIIGPIVGLLVAAILIIIILMTVMCYMSQRMRKTNSEKQDRSNDIPAMFANNFSYSTTQAANITPSDYEQPTPKIGHTDLHIATMQPVASSENIYEELDVDIESDLNTVTFSNILYEKKASNFENEKYYYAADFTKT